MLKSFSVAVTASASDELPESSEPPTRAAGRGRGGRRRRAGRGRAGVAPAAGGQRRRGRGRGRAAPEAEARGTVAGWSGDTSGHGHSSWSGGVLSTLTTVRGADRFSRRCCACAAGPTSPRPCRLLGLRHLLGRLADPSRLGAVDRPAREQADADAEQPAVLRDREPLLGGREAAGLAHARRPQVQPEQAPGERGQGRAGDGRRHEGRQQRGADDDLRRRQQPRRTAPAAMLFRKG